MVTRPFSAETVAQIRFLCPNSTDNEIEAALYKYNGDENMAVNELLNQQEHRSSGRPSNRNYYQQPAAPQVAVGGSSAPLQASVVMFELTA
ncbi:Ca(2+)-dependent cysteine protease [Perkinsus olseni]|uniref:Ca(2+)-dependent cysteine protease n=1 Tax=Perkinsus olseni TaxID=32597 RepID=A0A7J6NFB5_PEROL|nr:Ca(2+)-dependent cysteine protease [Perkinsus olseni]